jgi:glutamate formiminotransferase / formiminotetrahydrofolate cyclodeaminase
VFYKENRVQKMSQIIECVPNFSEGRDPSVLAAIAAAVESVAGVKLLHVDAGKAANRTVFTFVGAPEAVVEAAFRAIKTAAERIDMRQQTGEHPRIGATDVCPLIPISGISMAETVEWARQLGKKVGEELHIPVFLYENAATRPERRNLANIRSSEYEGLAEKMTLPDWQPDFGQPVFNPKSGATVIGARDFLIAYNVNLNTKNVDIANAIAADVRESGRMVVGENGVKYRQKGALKAVKAIGWFIEEYGVAQVSMNLTDIHTTPLHKAFDAVCESANKYGVRVTGSELIGLLPKRVLTEAGRFFLQKQNENTDVDESELLFWAVKTLGLGELAPFEVNERVIELVMNE